MENNPLDILSTVEKVPAPEFMLTRIYARIDKKRQELASPKLVYSLVACFLMFVLMNAVSLFQQQNGPKPANAGEFEYLVNANQLYNE